MKQLLYYGCPSPERAETERLLAAAHLSAVWVENTPHALAELQRQEMPVLLDLSRGPGALQAARDLRASRPDLLLFAVVDSRRPDLTTEAVLTGIADVFARPVSGRRVLSAIERERAQGSHARVVREANADLYCQSPSMHDVTTLIARAAAMRAGVMIRGEDGTGRQVVARAIHTAHAHDGEPFVIVNCALYDPAELETVLFGRTPLVADDVSVRPSERLARDSRLHEAVGGTIYFQNIVEAPTRVQGRLARILRDREAVLSDDGTPLVLDVRPMASADNSIDAAVQDGRVREDLFRKLSVIRIDVPPLRSRREDIPALANYFVRDVCATLAVQPKTLSRPALALISALPWRGNANELRTLIENTVLSVAGGRGIGIEDVLAHVRLDGGAVVFANNGTLRQARARFEREYIAAVLEQHHGRIAEAAKALGIQRTNLYRKMRSLRVLRDKSGAGLQTRP